MGIICGSGEPPAKWRLETLNANNKKDHKTVSYEQEDLIVRRGGVVHFNLKCFKPVKKESIQILVELGSTHKQRKKTQHRLVHQDDTLESSAWDLVATTASPSTTEFKLNVPSSARIGRWTIHVVYDGQTRTEAKMYVLANPFDPNGGCYYKAGDYENVTKEDFINEFVKADSGCVWQGTAKEPSCKKWVFGQFQAPFLDCVCDLLADAGDEKLDLGNLAHVVRILSGKLNAQGELGVMECKWGKFTGASKGKNPHYWDSSYDIMKQYHTTGKPVKYGQCWVMSGLMTAFVRCLGIPSRSITTYSSAYDMDHTITIDSYKDENGNKLNGGTDFVWNYHVWCEMWLNRTDIPSAYDGWHCCDACPVIARNSLHQCGPAPLKAIKKGDTYIGYDSGFMFSCVNSDYVEWLSKKDPNGGISVSSVLWRSKSWIGNRILTKSIGTGNFEPKEIISEYKFAEGTPENATAWNRALQFVGSKTNEGRTKQKMALLSAKQDLFDVSLECTNKKAVKGDTLEFEINITSKDKSTIVFAGTPKIVISSIYHTGEVHSAFLHLDIPHDQGSSHLWKTTIRVPKDKYITNLAPDGEGCLRADFIGKMSVGNEFHHVFSKCDLSVSELTDGIVTLTAASLVAKMGSTVVVTAVVKNTTETALEKAVVTFESKAPLRLNSAQNSVTLKDNVISWKIPSLAKGASVKQDFSIHFDETVSKHVIGTGYYYIQANLTCKTVQGANSQVLIKVVDEAEGKAQYFWL